MPPARSRPARLLPIAALVVLALPFLAPLLEPGWPPSHEGIAYAVRLSQLLRCWHDGMWSARWFPDLNNGAGYPFLCFYAPLYYVLAGAFAYAGVALDTALKAPTMLAAVVAGAGMYRLARQELGRAGSVVAAALFVYAPYLVRDVYIRGDLAEHLALALLPWALAAVLRLSGAHGPRDVVFAAATAALPILAHNITGLMSAGLLGIAGVAAWRCSDSRTATARAVLASGAGALLLTAFFWLPAMRERAWVRIDAMTEGPYAVAANYLSPRALLGPPLLPGSGQGLPMSFESAYVALALGLAALLLRRGRPAASRALLPLAALIFAGSLLMTTRLGDPVYRLLPLLRFVQFPWRFLGPASLGLALLGGIAFESLFGAVRPRVRVAAAAVVSLVAIAWVFPLLGPRPSGRIPAWALDPDTLASRRDTATGVSEYLPLWAEEPVNPREFEEGLKVVGDAAVLVAEHRVGRYDFTVEAHGPVTIVLRDLWYPGWVAHADGVPLDLGPRAGTGCLSMTLPDGRHEVRVRLEPTALRRVTRTVSALAAMLAVAVGLGARIRPRRVRDLPPAQPPPANAG